MRIKSIKMTTMIRRMRRMRTKIQIQMARIINITCEDKEDDGGKDKDEKVGRKTGRKYKDKNDQGVRIGIKRE